MNVLPRATPAPCPATKEGAEFVLETLKQQVYEELVCLGIVPARIFVLRERVEHGVETHSLEEVFFREGFDKTFEGLIVAIRAAAKQVGAYGVFYTCTGWDKNPVDANEPPDSVILMVDHAELGKKILKAPVTRNEDNKPLLGGFKEEDSDTFMGFLDYSAMPGIH